MIRPAALVLALAACTSGSARPPWTPAPVGPVPHPVPPGHFAVQVGGDPGTLRVIALDVAVDGESPVDVLVAALTAPSPGHEHRLTVTVTALDLAGTRVVATAETWLWSAPVCGFALHADVSHTPGLALTLRTVPTCQDSAVEVVPELPALADPGPDAGREATLAWMAAARDRAQRAVAYLDVAVAGAMAERDVVLLSALDGKRAQLASLGEIAGNALAAATTAADDASLAHQAARTRIVVAKVAQLMTEARNAVGFDASPVG